MDLWINQHPKVKQVTQDWMKSYEIYGLKLENSWPKGILEFPWVSMPNHLFRSIAFITSIGDIAHVAVASFRFWNLDLPGWQRRKVPCMTCSHFGNPQVQYIKAYINPQKPNHWTPCIKFLHTKPTSQKNINFLSQRFGRNHDSRLPWKMKIARVTTQWQVRLQIANHFGSPFSQL